MTNPWPAACVPDGPTATELIIAARLHDSGTDEAGFGKRLATLFGKAKRRPAE